ncbi:hypothetical protein PIB30_008011 [Stylosanthes scabra]|uniref:Ubiquitin-like protease family profile domain-containing protein n=1 Tax=Stylosanthes scabra TaxID=79078 RepID=A0ABU6V2Z1_9FABA|nr:hypothetical protein [Stylosanthes scabra]
MSESLVRVERKSKRKNDSVPAHVPVLGIHDSDSETPPTTTQSTSGRRGNTTITITRIAITTTTTKNISSPIDERTTLNKFASNILNQLLRWVGAPTILKKGSWSLVPTYIIVPQQPNDYDCAVFVMKWMELIDPTKLHGCCTYNIEEWTDPMLNEFRKKIVAKTILSKENTMRADAIRAAQEMRRIKPSAALCSPFLQLSTPDLPSK